MARILLTSSQVSVLLSSGIVVLCTLALFLSGYVIQQRTLRDLREAIRPRQSKPPPRAYLPDRFQTKMRELDDGTMVAIESEAEREAREQDALMVEIKETMPESEAPPSRDESEVSAEKQAVVDKLTAQLAQKTWMAENPDPESKNRVPITRAQRRQMIKEELQRLSHLDEPVYYQRRLW